MINNSPLDWHRGGKASRRCLNTGSARKLMRLPERASPPIGIQPGGREPLWRGIASVRFEVD